MRTIKILQAILVLLSISSKTAAQAPDETDLEPCELLETERSFDRSGGVQLWPGQRIPYTLDANVRENETEVILMAFNEFHNKTCLRFEPKTSSDPDNIHIKIRHEDPPRVCGSAHLCLQKIGPQTIYFSHVCVWVPTIVHELGHAACLDHEHVRWDRDEYLSFSECKDPSKIEKIEDRWTTRFQIYDYYSQMHYYCGGCVGLPSKIWYEYCGPTINKGLSVIDADKINEMYNCQGCYSHRWYRVDTLTTAQEALLINFAAHLEDHEPVYLCRGFNLGHIITGTYIPTEKACDIAKGKEGRVIAKDIQLFGLPVGSNAITNETTGYRLAYPEDIPFSSIVKTGRSVGNDNAYAAIREIEAGNGQKTILLGVMFEYKPTVGWFFHEGREIEVSHNNTDKIEFYTIACN